MKTNSKIKSKRLRKKGVHININKKKVGLAKLISDVIYFRAKTISEKRHFMMIKCSVQDNIIILNGHALSNSFKICEVKNDKTARRNGYIDNFRYFNILSIIDRTIKQKTIKGCKK